MSVRVGLSGTRLLGFQFQLCLQLLWGLATKGGGKCCPVHGVFSTQCTVNAIGIILIKFWSSLLLLLSYSLFSCSPHVLDAKLQWQRNNESPQIAMAENSGHAKLECSGKLGCTTMRSSSPHAYGRQSSRQPCHTPLQTLFLCLSFLVTGTWAPSESRNELVQGPGVNEQPLAMSEAWHWEIKTLLRQRFEHWQDLTSYSNWRNPNCSLEQYETRDLHHDQLVHRHAQG